MTTTTSLLKLDSTKKEDESVPVSPTLEPMKGKVPFKTWWTVMLVTAMMKSHKGYRKTRTSRYRNGDKQRKQK